MTRRSAADAALLTVAVAWGTTYLTTKHLVTPDTVVAVLALRFAVAVTGLAVLAGRRVSREHLRVGVPLGLLLSVIFALETFGVAHTSATNAGLVISLVIVLTPIVERAPVPPAFWAAMATALAGVVLLSQGGGLRVPAAGDALMLAAAAVRAVQMTLLHRRVSGRDLDASALTLVQMAVVTVVTAVVAPFAGASPVTVARSLGAADVAVLAYLAVVCTVFAFWVLSWAVPRTSASRAGLLLGSEPVWALLAGVALGGDRLAPLSVLGAVLVLGGIEAGRRLEARGRRDRRVPDPLGPPPVA
ncbi:MAG: DMT family transporter [Kineosporiaceae bacterium]